MLHPPRHTTHRALADVQPTDVDIRYKAPEILAGVASRIKQTADVYR
jgi:hypothetical protein